MEDIKIKLSNFTIAPGARYIEEGPDSGERYRNEIVEPNYKQAVSTDSKLIIDIDGCEGYPSSFFNEAFGGLMRRLREEGDSQITLEKLWETIILTSTVPAKIDRVKRYATDRYGRDKVIGED